MKGRDEEKERLLHQLEEMRRSGDELEKALASLRQAEMQLTVVNNALKSSMNGVIIADLDGRITYVNPAFLRMFEYGEEAKVLGEKAGDLFASEEIKKLTDVKAIIDRALGETGEFVARRGDGTTFPVEVSSSSVTDSSGKMIGRMASFIDISKRKSMEEQLRHAQKMEAVGTLAGGIAHNFNNILAGIMGYTSLVKEGHLEKGSPFIADMEAIEKLSWRGAALTRALLAFACKGKYNPQVLDIAKVVDDVFFIIGQTLSRAIRLRKELSPVIPSVFGDEGQLAQALINLCINACEAMPGGGTLTVRTAEEEPGDSFWEKHPELRRGPYVRVDVSDTGGGVAPGIREHIFEPFFTTKADMTGTGLGLSMVIGIVEGHGGCVEVETGPGPGSTFTIRLPASREAVRHEAPAKPPESLRGDEMILLVDDEEEFRRGNGRWLEERGYTVLHAASGEEALEMLEERKGGIDLVVLDMLLKDIDGATTYGRMKKAAPHIAVILCTGYSIDEKCRQTLREGARAVVQKPFEPAVLAGKIREVLDGEHPQSQ